MNYPKIHPLVNVDDTLVPMFTAKKASSVGTELYLSECVKGYYRLLSNSSVSNTKELTIRCPICGKHLKPITKNETANNHRLYICLNCSNSHIDKEENK